MNSLKNLMIICVLAAVGYGVYLSLSRNNVDSEQPFGATKPDPTFAKAPPPRGLPLSASPTLSVGGSTSTAIPAAPIAPPLAPPLAPLPSLTPPTNDSPGAAAVPTPLPSSTANTLSPPALNPPASAAGSTSTPGATLGAPEAPAGLASGPSLKAETGTDSAAGAVRNLPPPPGLSASDAPPPTETSLQTQFNSLMDVVRKRLDEGKFAEAQLALSILYGNPDLSADQLKQITDLLDQLAGTVIYSRQHLLAPAYVTQPGDTIDTVAQKYNLPWQLLANINGLMPPGALYDDTATKNQPLPVGKQLKVLQGPFDAVIHLDKRELTLMVQKRYAARFRIGVGRDQPKLEGEYTVRNKTLNPSYYGPDGVNIGPADPKNPLGPAWIGLTDRIGIHGTADPQSIGRDNNRGTISVSDQDLQNLYGILSVGSRVTIMR
jgi:hypothetical protein